MDKKFNFLLFLTIFCIPLGLLLISVPANATIITFGLSTEFSGATPPESTITPWLTATFDDSVEGENTVRLTMSAANLTDNEFVNKWYFNFDPILDPTQLTFTPVDNSQSVPTISTGINAFKADGDGLYDILFDFPPPPGDFDAEFTAGETVIYDITYVSAIDASSFNYDSEPDSGNGPFPTAAHVQGIGVDDTGSGWITIPEPAAMILLGSLFMGLIAIKRYI